MQLCAVGINYKTTPVSIRSKVAIGSRQLPETLLSLTQYTAHGVVLSTCNRTEVYSTSEKEDGASDIVQFLVNRSGLTPADLLPYFYSYSGEAAVRHLFCVAAGLDSMIIGEYEVLGQVRRALEEAIKAGTSGLPLLNLFRYALRVGRRVRVDTGISRNALSVSSVAVDLVRNVTGDIRQRKILVVGAGEAGKLVAQACRERGASELTVVSRSPSKGRALARLLQAVWVPMDNLAAEISKCDVVVSCSGAPHSVIKLKTVIEVMKIRSERPLTIVDIAVPSDVDSEVKQLRNVRVYDIDEITSYCDANRKLREDEIQQAMKIVNEEVVRFMAHWHELKVRPLVMSLLQKAEDIRQSKLATALKRMPSLSQEQQDCLELMTRAIIQKLLHDPVRCLKSNHKDENYTRIVKELFSLNESDRV